MQLEYFTGWSRRKADVSDTGEIDEMAEQVFMQGQCHSFALAVHQLTGFPIFGLYNGSDLADNSPGHCVIQLPDGEFIDIRGYSAVDRWENHWGPTTVQPLEASDLPSLNHYLPIQTESARSFAFSLLNKLNLEVAVGQENI